jgi:hypothetical protein
MANYEHVTTILSALGVEQLDAVRGGTPAWLAGCARGARALGSAAAIGGAVMFGTATLFQPVGSAAVGAAVGAGIGGVIGATVGCASGALGGWNR